MCCIEGPKLVTFKTVLVHHHSPVNVHQRSYYAIRHCVQGKSMDEFMHILECAIAYGMPKLLACCECYMAVEHQDKFKLLPSTPMLSSMLRMAEGLRGLKQKMSYEDDDELCDCPCCETIRDNKEWDCKCYRPAISYADRYMPCPKDFFDMAQRSQVTKDL